jgi:hypothetical protein
VIAGTSGVGQWDPGEIRPRQIAFNPRFRTDSVLKATIGFAHPKYLPNHMSHKWKFFRAGGFDQVKLESGADLMNLDQLDQKLWVALACPTTGLEFDPATLALIDSDKDGRIRVPELISAVKWAGSMLKDANELVSGGGVLPLASINEAKPEGLALLASAKRILANLGKGEASSIAVEEASDSTKIFANTAFNGDGVITEVSTEDSALKQVIADVAACLGTEADRCGKPGVNQAKIDAFFADATAHVEWAKKPAADATIAPLGDKTAAASAAIQAVQAKVDDHFGRCRLAAFDARAQSLLNRKEEEYLVFASKDLSITAAEIREFPLAKVEPNKALPLTEGMNPAWADAVAALVAAAVKPILGDKSSLTEADWAALKAKLAPFNTWQAGKAGVSVEKLGVARLTEIVGGKAKEQLTVLIAEDLAVKAEADSISNVEKLARYYRDLHHLCTNFVNFADFYDDGEPAVFQCGTLYLDQRSCTLCIPVADAGKHATMAGLAGAYLAYVDCVRKSTGEKMGIVAIFSQGDDDNLMVGRNGLFYDRKGRDYDATITKIVSNPISLRQAFWSPYKKFVRLIEELATKRAAAADAEANAKLAATAQSVTTADKAGAKPPEKKKMDVGTVAAMGVAFGAIGGFFTAIAAGVSGALSDYGPMAVVVIILGLMALISGPSMILAFIKLRKRNMGPILDANGWAVNAKAKVNVPFGTSLTGIAKLPPGSSRDLSDKYAEKTFPWKRWLIVLIVLFVGWKWYVGALDPKLPGPLKSTNVMGTNAPAYKAPVAVILPPVAGATNAPSATP